MATCMYCDCASQAPELTGALCEKHLQLRAIVNILDRRGIVATPRAVRAYLSLMADDVVIQPGEVPELLEQMQQKEAGCQKS